MNPEHEHFAELATRTLEGHPDLQEEARAELLGRLTHGGGELGGAVDRLKSLPARSSPPWRGARFLAFVMMALGLWAAWQVRHAMSEARPLQGLLKLGSTPYSDDVLKESLDPETRDFVFAGIGTDREAAKNLQRQWEIHPDQPGIYEEFVHRYLAANHKLPPDFQATWRQFDPDNGLWLYLEAVGKNEEWKTSGPPAGGIFSREAIDLLQQSAAAPRFESYLTALRNRRLALLPPADTLAEETRQFRFSNSALSVPTLRQQRDAMLNFSAAAEQAAADKDPARLITLIDSWERLISRLGAIQGTKLEMDIPIDAWKTRRTMFKAAHDLGLGEQVSRFVEIDRRFESIWSAYLSVDRHWTSPPPMSALARKVGTARGMKVIRSLSEFEPGRRVEYAVVERMSCLAAAFLVLLFLAGAVIESSRRGRRLNGLADGLRPLFTRADFAWTVGLGLALPALWYVGITRFTPLGLRDIGFTFIKPQPALIQAASALVCALLMSIQTVRWRITRRAGFLALRPRLPSIGWTMAGIAAAVIPLTGVVRWMTGNETRTLQAIAATGGLPLLWLLWEAAAVVFSPRDQALGGVLLSRRLIPPFAVLAALLLGAGVPLRAVERHWHARDPLTRADREHGGMTLWEARMVEALRSQILEVFPDDSRPPSGTGSASPGS